MCDWDFLLSSRAMLRSSRKTARSTPSLLYETDISDCYVGSCQDPGGRNVVTRVCVLHGQPLASFCMCLCIHACICVYPATYGSACLIRCCSSQTATTGWTDQRLCARVGVCEHMCVSSKGETHVEDNHSECTPRTLNKMYSAVVLWNGSAESTRTVRIVFLIFCDLKSQFLGMLYWSVRLLCVHSHARKHAPQIRHGFCYYDPP